jgi:hypothetical protein
MESSPDHLSAVRANDPTLLHNRACLADNEHADAVAEVLWKRVMAIAPNAQTAAGLACLLLKRGEEQHAENLARYAIREDPQQAWAWTTMGRLDTIQQDYASAIESFRTAWEVGPDVIERLFDYAAAVLRNGDYDTGWPLHTRGNKHPNFSPFYPTIPRWGGEKVKRLVILSYLGFGDEVMFARFIPWAAGFADEVRVWCRPASMPFYDAFPTTTDINDGDAYIENYALPEMAGTKHATIPVAKQRKWIQPGPLKVGIVWSGSDKTATNIWRKIPLAQMLRLAENPGIHLFSFQCGPRAADIGALRAQQLVVDLSGRLEGDWAATMAALWKIDLLVAVDCGTAHVAAALGLPVCLLLSAYSDWRWGKSSRTPWYDSVRIHRQVNISDWEPVIDDVIETIGHREAAAVKSA